MAQINIPNRPFASDLITGLMLPDGIFVTMLGRQNINVHLTNQDANAFGASSVYIETVSSPAIVVTPRTNFVGTLANGASTVVSWVADFRDCPPGLHFVSFIVERGGTRERIIKKIFVLDLSFDETDGSFVAKAPEGVMRARFEKLSRPKLNCCCSYGTVPKRETDPIRDDHYPYWDRSKDDQRYARIQGLKRSAINDLPDLFLRHERDFLFCPPGYLPLKLSYQWTPTPPFAGADGDLPFEDPWWKVVLCVIVVLLLIAAAIAEANDGTGSVVVSGGPDGGTGPEDDCCGVSASGGGTSYVAAGLVAAAAAAACLAVYSDDRDAFQRGRDATPPESDELTVMETMDTLIDYIEPVTVGKAFAVKAQWRYTRTTDKTTYSHTATDNNRNIHVTSSYEVSAPETVVRDDPDKLWIVKARFFDANEKLLTGNELFVQCFLVGPSGEWHRFPLQDDGIFPDDAANDGEYCGTFNFRQVKAQKGLWEYFVIAQDVNDADPSLPPQEAAKIIGGMVLTNQLTISFTEDECRFVPDGHVMVV